MLVFARLGYLVLLLTMSPSRLLAAEVQPPFDIEAGGELGKSDGQEEGEWGGVPAVFRTPETGLGAGAVLIYIPTADGKKISSLLSGLVLTEKRQVIAAIYTERYFAGDQWVFELFTSYQDYPDTYFGIGNATESADAESYTWTQRKLAFSMRYLLSRDLRLGVVGAASDDSFRDQKPGGLLLSDDTPGSRGGRLHGLGASLRYETFDDAFSPRSGEVVNVSHIGYAKALGSDYQLRTSEINAKKFWSLSADDVLGLQFYAALQTGEVPFYQLAQLGGKNLLRGYFQGRYRDKNFVLSQGEYRRSLAARWGGVLFLGLGDVAARPTELELARAKPSTGFGLRYQLVERQRINVRLDFGFGRGESNPSVYLYILEAF